MSCFFLGGFRSSYAHVDIHTDFRRPCVCTTTVTHASGILAVSCFLRGVVFAPDDPLVDTWQRMRRGWTRRFSRCQTRTQGTPNGLRRQASKNHCRDLSSWKVAFAVHGNACVCYNGHVLALVRADVRRAIYSKRLSTPLTASFSMLH